MQSISNRDLGKASVVTSPFWWTSSEMHMPHSSVSKNLNLGMSSPDHLYPAGKQLGKPLHEQDSSSTQSAGESYQEVAGSMTCNAYGQFLPMSTGTGGKRVDKKLKPKFSIETPEGVYSAANNDHNQPVFHVSYASADPYLMPNYGQHAIMHPQMMSIASGSRVPLPLDWPDEGPVYVNAKQYRGILRRRQLRAKLEAQNKVAKGRKPYLHESRHLHAMKRARGSGGRFLNTKQLQQAQQDNQQQQFKLPVPNADKVKFSVHSTGPQVPSISNNDLFQLPDPLRFGEFRSNRSGGMNGDIAGRIILMENSTSREVPFIR